jgi:hypothetical protein
MLEENPKAPATVILERLRPLGYAGGIAVLKERLAKLRPVLRAAQELPAHQLPAGRDRPARLVAHRAWTSPSGRGPGVRPSGW